MKYCPKLFSSFMELKGLYKAFNDIQAKNCDIKEMYFNNLTIG